MLRYLILSFALLANTSFAQSPRLNASGFTFAQAAGPSASGFDRTYQLRFRNPVQDKNFYLLSLFQRHPEVAKLLSRNAVLRKLSNDRIRALRMAATCNDVDCFDRLFRFSDSPLKPGPLHFKGL